MKGDESQLLNAARSGQVLSNDLVYDANAAQWSFARSLSVLRGFPLRSRTSNEAVEDADSRVIETGRRLLARRQVFQASLTSIGRPNFFGLTHRYFVPYSRLQEEGAQKNLDNGLGLMTAR